MSPRSSTKAMRLQKKTAPTRAVAHPQPSSGSGQPTSTQRPMEDASRRPAEGKEALASSSESDPEGPIAAQMLSFVMDDPDFESEESDKQHRVVRTGPLLGFHHSVPWQGLGGAWEKPTTM